MERMNWGNRRNASGQHRSRANALSNSDLTPVRGRTGSNSSSSSRNNNSTSRNPQPRREENETGQVPGTNVVRIMRRVIPTTARITDDAKEAVQECVAEYISFITGEANERCLREHRKTLTPEDILSALAKLGFDDYVQPLTLYLNRYRQFESQRTSVDGEPNVIRTVSYQNQGGSHQAPLSSPPSPSPSLSPPPPPPMFFSPEVAPPPLPPPLYFNPQVAPPLPLYLLSPAEAMNGNQGYRVAPPGSAVDAIAGSSVTVAYAPAGSTNTSSGGYPHNAAEKNPGGRFFQ